jgi:ABC-type uncharacterized transport system permease subunit
VQTPVDIFTGHTDGLSALAAIGVQMLWVGLLFGVCRVVFVQGRRMLVFQGG